MDSFKLLICDDEVDLLEIFGEYFANQPVEVTLVNESTKALDLLRDPDRHFDAVLSDINMPQVDGLTLLSVLREEGNEIPFVFITGYGDKKMAIRALTLGAFDFLEKPCDMNLIINTMMKALNLGRRLHQVEMEIHAETNKLEISELQRRILTNKLLKVFTVKHMGSINRIKGHKASGQDG